MTEEAYLFDSKLRDAIEDLIKEAKNKLVIIMIYIKLEINFKSNMVYSLPQTIRVFTLS